jgi:hypothetical protein
MRTPHGWWREASSPGDLATPSAHLGELGPELEHRLRVHLADPRLGDAEHLADLGQGEALVVVERDDDLLPLGQLVDRLRQQELRLLRLEGADRVFGLGVLEGVDERQLVALLPADAQQLVERDDVDVGDLGEDLVQVVESDAEALGDLGLGRRPPQLALQGGVGALDLARLVPDRPGYPVDRPELVDDRAADPRDRVRLELDRAVDVSPKIP